MKKDFESVHEENKSFKCKICDCNLSWKDQMKQHVLSVHEGNYVMQCDICDYSRFQKGNMKKDRFNSLNEKSIHLGGHDQSLL